MTKNNIIDTLGLIPHPNEGGYFRRTFESKHVTKMAGSHRKLASSIYYLLTDDNRYSYLHRNKSDIVHCYHCGSPIRYTIIVASGHIEQHVLGTNLSQGEIPQLIVAGGDWKASELVSGEYGLISEVVIPEFDYEDNEIATARQISTLFPELANNILRYIKPENIATTDH
ncbi:MAG: cupin domain-containing protein [Gammaproteobacteria bacterium]|nr:cupin domain-containing protein [Gammaproteobacteria bacterium]